MNRRHGRRPLRFAASALWTPASLALTGWYRDYPNFTGIEPWRGSVSLGPSGARTLYHGASSPSSGNFLNSHQTATFDGVVNSTNALEGSGEQMQDYFTATAWSFWALVYPTAAPAPAGDPRFDPGISDDSGGGFWSLNISSNGAEMSQVGNGVLVTVTRPCGINAWHLIQTYFDGTNVGARVDSGAWATLPCGPMGNPPWTGATNYFRLGTSIPNNHFTGQMADVGVSNVAIGRAAFDNVKTYINNQYHLAL